MTRGLFTTPERRLVIPGNHDRFKGKLWPKQRHTVRFEDFFGTKKDYPYSVGFRRPGGSSAALLFFVFDSTPSVASFFNPFESVARGRLEEASCDFIKTEVHKIATDKSVKGLDGSLLTVPNFDDSIRIVVLHHHPIPVEGDVHLLDRVYNKLGFLLMENSELFVRCCFEAGIDIVLFGHQHQQYHKVMPPPSDITTTVLGSPPHKIHFYCCPSTSEQAARNSGFYVFDFQTEGFRVELFESKDTHLTTEFVPAARKEWPHRWRYARAMFGWGADGRHVKSRA
jgi:3',5'-cyclic AMP phosphodiesterase CpdA